MRRLLSRGVRVTAFLAAICLATTPASAQRKKKPAMAPPAAAKRGSSRGAALTAGASEALRADWIIATGNARIGAAGSKLA